MRSDNSSLRPEQQLTKEDKEEPECTGGTTPGTWVLQTCSSSRYSGKIFQSWDVNLSLVILSLGWLPAGPASLLLNRK